MAKTNPKSFLRSKPSVKGPHATKGVGKGGKVIASNAIFDIDDIIKAVRFWSNRNAYDAFKLNKFEEEIRKDGKYYYTGNMTFERNLDFYLKQRFSIDFQIKKAEKIQVEGPNGEIRNLMRGNIGFSTDTDLDLDYDNTFKDSKGILGFAHHIFFEYLYPKTYESHKLDLGINTGKIHELLKDQIASFKIYKER